MVDVLSIQERKNEYSFLAEHKHLGDNLCLVGFGGSYAYGTNTETSDVDIRGFATRTADEILLGTDYEQIVVQHDDVDTTIYSLDKMFHLLAGCNPNMIEMLGLLPEHYLYLNEIGKRVIENRKIFLSQRCIQTFGGYATQQLYRIQQKSLSAISELEYQTHIKRVLEGMSEHLEQRYGLSAEQISPEIADDGSLKLNVSAQVDAKALSGILGEINKTIQDYYKPSKRNKKALEHGKITKHSMHLIRLYLMVIDLLLEGEIVTYRANEHDLLMSIRNGAFLDTDGKPSNDFFDLVREYEDKFESAKRKTKLPVEPDTKAIDELRLIINRHVVKDLYF